VVIIFLRHSKCIIHGSGDEKGKWLYERGCVPARGHRLNGLKEVLILTLMRFWKQGTFLYDHARECAHFPPLKIPAEAEQIDSTSKGCHSTEDL
jgi:hypothetical protein